MPSVISFENVSFRYPKAHVDALCSVDLQIPAGAFFALLGPNGAGKTTLLRLLCGRFSKFSGSLAVDEHLRNGDGFLDAHKYGVLLENPGVYPKLSIEEYLSYFAGFYGMGENACLPGGAARARVEMLASRLELSDLKTRMGALSLGNRQKVQVIRAMLPNPKLLILDEPVANLDPMSREMVWALVEEWRRDEGGTAIVCSHILAEMEQYASHYAIIDGGRILKAGEVSALESGDTDFSVSVSSAVDAATIKAALASAGIPVGEVSVCKSSLATVYREAVRK